ncbi:MAG: hypothetical protein ABIR32_14805 [Ilumatobacteraceae bacterium]
MSKPVCLPRLLVCTGKHCRKDKGFAKLVSLASETTGSLEAPCQGVCNGPVVAVQQGDDVRWFEKVRSKSLRKRVAVMAASGRSGKDLRNHEVTKRHNIVRGERRMKPLQA